MRELFAILATAALLFVGTVGIAGASHQSKSPRANPPDCAIEVDPIGVCLG